MQGCLRYGRRGAITLGDDAAVRVLALEDKFAFCQGTQEPLNMVLHVPIPPISLISEVSHPITQHFKQQT